MGYTGLARLHGRRGDNRNLKALEKWRGDKCEIPHRVSIVTQSKGEKASFNIGKLVD